MSNLLGVDFSYSERKFNVESSRMCACLSVAILGVCENRLRIYTQACQG